MNSTPSVDTEAGSPLYVRQATGLVRELRPVDALLMSLAFISIPLGYFFFAQLPDLFPGANTPLAFVLTGLLVAPAMAVYALFAAIMPRSGGDLVFVGRVIHPALGFINNFGFVVFQACASAFLMLFFIDFAIPSMFQNITLTTGNDWWATAATNLTESTPRFLITGALIALMTGLYCIGLKWVIRVFVPLMIGQLLGVVITFLILLFSTHGGFLNDLDALGLSSIVSDATKAGFAEVPKSFSATLQAVALLIAVPGLAFMWSYFGGEVRRTSNTSMWITMGGVVISTVVLALMVTQANRVFGEDFQGAASFLDANAPDKYLLAGAPFINSYLGILTGSTWWVSVIGITFAMGTLAAPFAGMILVTRSLFAYSFDRMLPSGLADVNMRYHTPVRATLLVGLVMIGFLAGFVYSESTFTDFIVASSMALFIVTAVTGLAGALLPYLRKDLYEMSPTKRTILGVPLITVLGVLAVVIYSIYLYILIDKVGFATRSYWFVGGVYTLGLVITIIAYIRNRSAGINLNTALRELPPE
ncbi:MAG: APC family permease [bacterium]